MNTQKSNLLIVALILVIIVLLIKDFSGFSGLGLNFSFRANNTISGSKAPDFGASISKKFICPDVKEVKKEMAYDSCVKRFSDFDLSDEGAVRTLYTKAGNPFIYDIYTHIYTYIIGSLLMDDFFVGESDSFGENKFLGLAFYKKYYSIKNPENQKEALTLLGNIKSAYAKGKTIETKYPFIETFYNGYIKSTYYPKREYLKYFNTIVGDCAKTGNCKSLESFLFTEQLIFFYFYLNNLEIKSPDNVCKEFTCAYLQKRFYD